MPDKYDEVAENIQALYHQGVYFGETEKISAILRSAFPLPAEDARQCAVSITGLDPDAYKQGCPAYLKATNVLDSAAAEIESFAQSRVEPFRRVLEQYANAENWTVDEDGVARIWIEPGSSTPTAYHGFELAKNALLSDSPAKEDAK